MDSLYLQVLNEAQELLKYDSASELKGWYNDGIGFYFKNQYESFFKDHIDSQFLYYALEQAKELVLGSEGSFIASILNNASSAEILNISELLEFDQLWGRDSYTEFAGKKTNRAHKLGFKAYEILRLAVEISYNDAAAEASAELGIEIY